MSSADILNDLDLLDDWLAGKGYGEEAGLVLRAMTLINAQARELRELRAKNEKMRKALRIFADTAEIFTDETPNTYPVKEYLRHFRTAAAVLKEMGDE